MSLVRVEWQNNNVVLSVLSRACRVTNDFEIRDTNDMDGLAWWQTQKGDRGKNPLSWSCNGCNSQLFNWTNEVKECKKNADRWNASNSPPSYYCLLRRIIDPTPPAATPPHGNPMLILFARQFGNCWEPLLFLHLFLPQLSNFVLTLYVLDLPMFIAQVSLPPLGIA
jgi:hypothetical protein